MFGVPQSQQQQQQANQNELNSNLSKSQLGAAVLSRSQNLPGMPQVKEPGSVKVQGLANECFPYQLFFCFAHTNALNVPSSSNNHHLCSHLHP